nr:MAG TPA: hypothetical protein [Caudoviricetes sp.]
MSIAHCFCFISGSLSGASLNFFRVSDYIFTMHIYMFRYPALV